MTVGALGKCPVCQITSPDVATIVPHLKKHLPTETIENLDKLFQMATGSFHDNIPEFQYGAIKFANSFCLTLQFHHCNFHHSDGASEHILIYTNEAQIKPE